MSVILRRIQHVINDSKGAIMPAFAIIIPAAIGMMSFSLDGANALSQRVQLSRAVAEASLAIAAPGVDKMTATQMNNAKKLITQYIDYFLPGTRGKDDIVMSSNQYQQPNGIKSLSYTFDVSVHVPVLFRALPGIQRELRITNGQAKIKKFTALPADYVFVVDFSASQAGAPMAMLKRVIKTISTFVLAENSNSRIAIVPFSTGVPVKLPGKNERGGDRVGCSVLFVPKPGYEINYEFWADKYTTNYAQWNYRMFYMDQSRWYYYQRFVRSARPAMTLSQMRDKFCIKNEKWGATRGHAEYSCKNPQSTVSPLFTSYDDIFSEDSQKIIKAEYYRANKIIKEQRDYLTIEHDLSIDYEATLEKMFGDEAIITFPVPWTALAVSTYRSFNQMCHNSGWDNHIPGSDLSHVSARSWLIELTNDIKEIDQFQKMLQQGYTHLSSGLIRSVPVMMKGRNQRKVFIMLSDGGDNAGKGSTDKWLKKYHLCDKIKQGILSHTETNTKKVEMYYISTNTALDRVKYWADNCVGAENAKTSTTSEALIEAIKGIMTDETGHFAS